MGWNILLKCWTLHGLVQTMIIGTIFIGEVILCLSAVATLSQVTGLVGVALAWMTPVFLYRSIFQSIVKEKTKEEISFWEFPYCKIIVVSIVSHIIERVLGDMFIAVTLVTHMCTPVILILLVIYPESTKDITSIKKLLIKGIKATFEKHFLAVIIACVFDFISVACLFLAIPVVGFRLPIVGIMEPISKLFLIPTIYFTILSSVYIMNKIVEYEEKENSLSFENVDRWRT